MDKLTLFIAITSAAVVLQMLILGGMFLTMRKTSARMEALAVEVRAKALPAIEQAHTMLIEMRPQVNEIISNVQHSTHLIKGHINRLDATVNDALDRTRLQVIRTDELDFESVTRRQAWYQFARTHELWAGLNKGNSAKQALAVQFHMRLVRPITAVLLAVLGLSVILKDQNRHVFISAGLCLIMAAAFNGCVIGSKLLGDSEAIPAAIAAWVPVLVFGPIAFALFDAIHT